MLFQSSINIKILVFRKYQPGGGIGQPNIG